jgi:hypothetical protein
LISSRVISPSIVVVDPPRLNVETVALISV